MKSLESLSDWMLPQVRAERDGVPRWVGALREAADLQERADKLITRAQEMRCKGIASGDNGNGPCALDAGHDGGCEFNVGLL